MLIKRIKKQLFAGLLALLLIACLAACRPEKKTFTITWDIEGVTSITTVDEGATPVYSGATPAKTSTAEFDYTFSGWSPAITAVTGAATYTAQFTENTRSYAITFKNYDGAELQSSILAYGATPVYSGETPTKASADGVDYTFNGWSPTITSVTGAATYTAQFTESNNGTLRSKPIALTLDTPITAIVTGNEQKYEGKSGKWYSFTPTATATYVIKATAANPDDCFVYLFDSTTGAEIDCNDDGSILYRFRLEYELTAGTTYYYFVTFYDAQSGEITFKVYRPKPVSELTQTINSSEGAEHIETVIELIDMANNGDEDADAACHSLDIAKLASLAGNASMDAVRVIMDLADDFNNSAAKNALETFEVTDFVTLAESGSWVALDFLMSLEWFGNKAAQAALEVLDVSAFKAQAESGDVDSAYALMSLDGFNNTAAREAIDNLDLAALVNLAKNADGVAVYIIFCLAKNYKLADAIAATSKVEAALIALAESCSIDAVYALVSLTDFAFITPDILNDLDVTALIELAVMGDVDAQSTLSELAENYKNAAAQTYLDSLK